MSSDYAAADEQIRLAKTYFAKVDAGDPALLEMFTEDVQAYFPKIGTTHGKSNLARTVQRLTNTVRRFVHDPSRMMFTQQDNRLVVEGIETGEFADGTAWPAGARSEGRYCNVFEFRARLISRLHIHVDPDFAGRYDDLWLAPDERASGQASARGETPSANHSAHWPEPTTLNKRHRTPRRLEGKIAVVTGGTTGIGLATAKRFVAEGARVYVTGRRKVALDAAVAAIGEDVTGVQADSSKADDLDRLFAQIAAEHGRIDVLFVNAGGGTLLPLGEITDAQFDDTFGRNVKGTLFTVQKALPLLGTGASVILTASTTSVKGTAAFSVYSASKAAVRNLVRSWILDIKGRGIRINVVSPGPVETPGLKALAETPELESELLGNLESHVPLGRLGHPDEIAAAVVFLASDEASFVNGIELFVDGGVAQV